MKKIEGGTNGFTLFLILTIAEIAIADASVLMQSFVKGQANGIVIQPK